MTCDLLRLVRHEDRLFVGCNSTMYGEPIALRLWWPVRNTSHSPGAVGVDENLDGAVLNVLPTGSPGPDYRLADRPVDMWLTQGGQTVAVRRWEAEVPPPKVRARMNTPFWRSGTWCQELRHGRKVLPVAWDGLSWNETPVGHKEI